MNFYYCFYNNPQDEAGLASLTDIILIFIFVQKSKIENQNYTAADQKSKWQKDICQS